MTLIGSVALTKMEKNRTTQERRRPTARVQLNSHLLPALVGLLVLLEILFPYKGWIALLVGLGGGWLVSYIWARSLADGLHLTREMRYGWAQVGDRLEERFTLINQSHLPALWAEVTDRSTMPDYEGSRVTGVDAASWNRWRIDGLCTRRGLFTLGPTTLRTGDPLGLYTVSLNYPDMSPLMVLPPVIDLPAIEIMPGGRAGEGRRLCRDPLERTVSSSAVREYQPGDSLTRIHWRISAHRDALFARLFDSTPTSDWWVLLDLDQRVQAGQGADSTEEHGIILAASLADRGLKMGRAVGLATHAEELVWLPPQKGKGQSLEILYALALANPGPCSLGEMLRRLQPALKQRSVLVIITPSTASDWVGALWPLLRRGTAPTVLLLDPVSFGGSGDMSGTTALLANLGVTRYLITRDLLDQCYIHPPRLGEWEWRISATGRAIPLHRPRDMGWQRLS